MSTHGKQTTKVKLVCVANGARSALSDSALQVLARRLSSEKIQGLCPIPKERKNAMKIRKHSRILAFALALVMVLPLVGVP